MHFYLTTLLLIISAHLLGQAGGVKGIVSNEDTGEPLLFCSVIVYKDNIFFTGTETGLSGQYAIDDLPAGEYYLEFTGNNFKPTKQPCEVFANSTTTLDVRIKLCQSNTKPIKRCPYGHTNKLTEIRYGLVTGTKKEIRQLHRQIKRGEIDLAGCDVPQCPDYYYCREHNVSW